MMLAGLGAVTSCRAIRHEHAAAPSFFFNSLLLSLNTPDQQQQIRFSIAFGPLPTLDHGIVLSQPFH